MLFIRFPVLEDGSWYGDDLLDGPISSCFRSSTRNSYVVLVPWMVKFVEFEATSVHGSSGDVANTNDELIKHGSTGMGTGQL